MPDLSRVPPSRLPLDRLLEVLPKRSPIREALLDQTTFAAKNPETAVNAPDGDREYAAASTRLTNGTTIAVWNDFTGTDPTAQGGHLHGRLLDGSGLPLGPEIVLNSEIAIFLNEFKVAALADGGFVVVWTSADVVDGSGRAVLAQRFSATGAALGPEVVVNSQTSADQRFADVAGLKDGGFVITWSDAAGDRISAGDTYGWGVRAQIFSAAGSPVGGEISVNTSTLGFELYPTVAALEGGGFVISWANSVPGRSTLDDIRLQAFDATGIKVAPERTLSSAPGSRDYYPDIAATDDGGFLVIWRQLDQASGIQSIVGQRFDSPTDSEGSAFVVTSGLMNLGVRPDIAVLPDGFVVVWEGGALGSEDVYARVFRDWDEPWTDSFLALTQTENRDLSAGVSALDNGFLVTWSDVAPSPTLAGEVQVRPFELTWA